VGALAIALPIGLSFHIFQSLSYTIEVYRGNQQPERHLGIFALYVMFYPQLVAGPIERPQNLLHQFHEPKHFDADRVSAGIQRMLWGLFKKIVIADRLAMIVSPIFAHPTEYTGLTLMLVTVLFAVQIYCDFSGYSDIALGAAQVMGFTLIENFRRPYGAASIREFWTRWHISLSTWFKDYLYIPMGGNRVPKWRWSLNLVVVFLASGLWHGANWTFVVWGFLHGGYMVVGLWTQPLRARLAEWSGIGRWPRLQRAWQVGVTFSLVCFAWIFFRASSLPDAWYIATHLGQGLAHQLTNAATLKAAVKPLGSPTQLIIAIIVVALMEAVHLLQARGSVRELLKRQPVWVRWPAYQVLILLIFMFGVYVNQAFIYFQF
jgi:D-alanyl-lipoteichoic acid acyltransferase DltB (MBOAT superfamily)